MAVRADSLDGKELIRHQTVIDGYKLAHEKNFGAECLKCGPKCEGLDLHFWRKICRNCKCKQNEHRIKSDTAINKIVKDVYLSNKGIKNNAIDVDLYNGGIYTNAKSFGSHYTPSTSQYKPETSDAVKIQQNDIVEEAVMNNHNTTVGHKLAHDRDTGAKCLKCGPKCKGLDLHFWRKICRNCNCKQEEHDIQSEEALHKSITDALLAGRGITHLGKLNINDSHGDLMNYNHELKKNVTSNFSIAPKATASAMHKYIAGLPAKKAAHLSKEGSHYRIKQMAMQLPKHDFDSEKCDGLSQPEVELMQAFNNERNQNAIGQGEIKEKTSGNAGHWTCEKCKNVLSGGDVAIFAERAGSEKCWHPNCFVCSTCEEVLADLIYFFKDGNLYCGRHHAELTRVRCAACDELIFTPEYTKAEGKNWHLKHFCCYNCDTELGGQNYVVCKGNPHCIKCYDKNFAKICASCNISIHADGKRVTYKDKYWHAQAECFKCVGCHKSMLGEKFIFRDNKVFCSPTCVKKCST